MRTFFSRFTTVCAAMVLSVGVLLPQTAFAAPGERQPLLLKPTGSCPAGVTEAAPNSTDPAVPVTTARACIDGICEGTNIPCNYSLDDIKNTAIGIGNWIFGIIGVVVLLMFIYGGAVWLMSAGNSSSVEHGRAVMTGSLIGLILIFSAGAIVKVFLKTLGANPDIYNSLPIEGNSTGTNGNYTTDAQEQQQTVCNCKVTGISGSQVAEKNFTGKPGANPLVNVATCKAHYTNMLKSQRDAEDPGATDTIVQQEYALYISNATCGVVTQ